MDVSPQDRDMAIRTIMGEVDQADPDMGRAAVGSVILNRLNSGKYGGSIPDIVLARGQFEPWSTRRRELMGYSTRSPEYQHAGEIFDAIASGKMQDPTGGATHFYSPGGQRALGRQPPSWSNEYPPAGQIGGHAFFYGPGSRQTGAGAADDILSSWPTGPAKTAPAPSVAPAQAAPDGEDLLGAWSPAPASSAPPSPAAAPDAAVRPDATGKPRIVIRPAGTPEPPKLPADASADDAGTYVARLLAEHQEPGIVNAAIRTGAGVLRGVGDVADTLATGIAAAGRGGSNALATLGAISPETAASVGTWAQGVNDKIARENALFEQGASGSPGATLGRIGGQIVGTAPLLAGPAALGARATATMGPVERALVTGAGYGGGAAALTSSSSDQPLVEQVGTGAATGAIAGPALQAGSLVGRGLSRALFGVIDPETARLAQAARNTYDIPVTAGQMSSNPMMRFADSVLQRLPFTGYGARTAAQQGAFNRAISNAFGEDVESITPQVMDRARTRIGHDFDNVAQRTNIAADHQFGTELSATLHDAHQVLSEEEIRPLARQIQNIIQQIDPATGTISGRSYQALTRRGAPLDRALQSANPNIRHYAGQIREALDDAMERSAAPDVVDQLRTARRQWRAMKTVEDLVEKSPTGDISPALLMGAARSSYGGTGGMAYGGGGALADLARIGQRFIKEPPSSGTSERLALMGLGKAALGGLGIGGAAYFDPDNFQRDALLAGLAFGGGRIGSRFLRSDALANTLIRNAMTPRGVNPFTNALPVAAPLAALGYRNADRLPGQ